MKRPLLLFLALSGCGPARQPAPADAPKTPVPAASPAAAAAADGSLTGLYESGAGQQRNQLCMIGRGADEAQFGLVVWGGNMHSCSGTGIATRKGDALRLAMAGDSECAIEATLAGGTITLPKTPPRGCAYYCGARARLDGASFTRKSGTREGALEAKDLVGESLCHRN